MKSLNEHLEIVQEKVDLLYVGKLINSKIKEKIKEEKEKLEKDLKALKKTNTSDDEINKIELEIHNFELAIKELSK